MVALPKRKYELSVTTQGPLYPPSEICDFAGNFIVVGIITELSNDATVASNWGAAIVSADSPVPPFGARLPYNIVKRIDLSAPGSDADLMLYTLPLPLPCNNYPMVFAPQQRPDAHSINRPKLPLNQAVPDYRVEDGRQYVSPITLGDWLKARGELSVEIDQDGVHVLFELEMSGLVPLSLYTVMSLREHDLRPDGPTRPGPLGIPNCFVTDSCGTAHYRARMPNPFPEPGTGNRIQNVIVLFMSTEASYGGAIGLHGLGGDIHAHLKIKHHRSFDEFVTRSLTGAG
ncbi:hypothetical protein [Paraburkholderia humisilvae]|uniref:Uncharacterized protein n=1 Tax=Paraburkholderia humisilvae TaxID=627669 RepID=A0A6J5F6K9_9BURK|nr:hypothetical protein [Paraburkholderia humisilvae]CAB3774508.1 hypothetical protein LMG29542_07885 [Paraburkholderia humisilvae]